MSGSSRLESKKFLELVQEEARLFVDTDLAISYKLSRDHVDEMFFEKELAKLSTDDVVMPIMRCSDLVDCSCDDLCDWETAFPLRTISPMPTCSRISAIIQSFSRLWMPNTH